MHKLIILVAVLFVLFVNSTACVKHADQKAEDGTITPFVEIRRPNLKEEFGVIWHVLKSMPFYSKHGYEVTLPAHNLFEELKFRSPNLIDRDREKAYRLFKDEIYRANDYAKGLEGLKISSSRLKPAFNRLEELNRRWGFKVFQRYDVVLTLYGPGGHFNPNTGKIILKTTLTVL